MIGPTRADSSVAPRGLAGLVLLLVLGVSDASGQRLEPAAWRAGASATRAGSPEDQARSRGGVLPPAATAPGQALEQPDVSRPNAVPLPRSAPCTLHRARSVVFGAAGGAAAGWFVFQVKWGAWGETNDAFSRTLRAILMTSGAILGVRESLRGLDPLLPPECGGLVLFTRTPPTRRPGERMGADSTFSGF
jgi:hypothetical protein